MRVAVTGGTGFLGAHIVERLAEQGHEAVCMVRPKSEREHLERLGVTQIPGSLDDVASLKRLVKEADAVMHAAGAIAAPSKSGYHEANATGTKNLLAACTSDPPDRFVYVSSLAAKGPSPTPTPRPAHDPPRPVSTYGTSKLGGETAVREHADQHDTATTIIRPPALYGPRDRGLLGLLKAARWGFYPALVPPGARFSMLYGPDCARLIVAQLKAPPMPEGVRILEPADGPPHTDEGVRESLIEALGSPLRTLRLPGPLLTGGAGLTGLVTRLTGRPVMFNPDKVRELRAAHWVADTDTLGGVDWEPEMDLPGGLRATHAWYETEGWL